MPFSDTNALRLTRLKESTLGTVPGSGTPVVLRLAGQSLNRNLSYTRSEEYRTDRMVQSTALTDADPSGDLTVETSFGNSDDLKESALSSSWVANGGSLCYFTNAASDTPITNISAANVITVNANNVDIVVGHLVQLSGTTSNNFVRKVTAIDETSSTVSLITVDGAATTLEATVPVGATLRVVGFQGTSADVTAIDAATAQSGSTSTLVSTIVGGLGSTTLNFTTLGLTPFTWVKVGGIGSGNRFTVGTTNNGWCRILEVSANKLRFDRVPTGWAADVGTGKTIKVWTGDYMKNGVTKVSFSFERNHTDITTYEYMLFRGMMVNTLNVSLQTGNILTENYSLMGMSASPLDATGMPGSGSYTDAPTGDVMNAVGDILEMKEGNSSPGVLQSLTLTTNNNLRNQKGIDYLGNAGIGMGDFEVGLEFTAYFESGDILNRHESGTETSFSFIIAQDGQAYSWDIPRVKMETADVQAGSRNTDATVQVRAIGLRHAASVSNLILGRYWYYED